LKHSSRSSDDRDVLQSSCHSSPSRAVSMTPVCTPYCPTFKRPKFAESKTAPSFKLRKRFQPAVGKCGFASLETGLLTP
jgi:hypothetical protein